MKLGQQAMEALKSQIDGALEIGDDLVVAGVIAIEGTQILIEKEKEKLLEYFSDGFLWNTVRTLEKCRVPEMLSEPFKDEIHARYDLGTGGVLSGLWKMTEASGTGNMKLMLNGAITLGTLDGANVEIHDLVGDDNIYIFGENSEQVIDHYAKADYVSRSFYEKSPVIKAAVDFIVSDQALAVGHKENLERLYNELLNKDWFMTLLDLEDYIATKDRMFADYEDQEKWKRMMVVNIAKAGFFSSDRTIAEYNRDIWKLK